MVHKRLLFGCPSGVPKIEINSSLRTLKWGSLSKAASKDKIGLDPLRQLPVSRSSSMVCTFVLKIYRWPKWCCACPKVQIFSFAKFKKQSRVAALHLGNLVDGGQVTFGVKLHVFLVVWQKSTDVPLGDGTLRLHHGSIELNSVACLHTL